MRRYTFGECCQLLAVDYRKLRTLLTVAGIHPEDGHELVAGATIKDRRAKTISDDEMERLRALLASSAPTPVRQLPASADMLPVLDTIMERLEAMEQRMQGMELGRMLHRERPPGGYAPPPLNAINSTLPEGWASVNEMERRHRLPGTTLVRHMARQAFPFHIGEWMHRGSPTKAALDPDEQVAFVAYWSKHNAFRECEQMDCPCHPPAI